MYLPQKTHVLKSQSPAHGTMERWLAHDRLINPWMRSILMSMLGGERVLDGRASGKEVDDFEGYLYPWPLPVSLSYFLSAMMWAVPTIRSHCHDSQPQLGLETIELVKEGREGLKLWSKTRSVLQCFPSEVCHSNQKSTYFCDLRNLTLSIK